jgi:ABC-2 type transport system permease protein
MLNPLAMIIEQNRHAVIDPGAPTAIGAMGQPWHIALPIAIMVLSVVLGFWIFNREAPKIAEQI